MQPAPHPLWKTTTVSQMQTDAKGQSLWITVIYATWPWKAPRKTHVFGVSMSFRQASNCPCPFWPSHSRLNQCNIQHITTSQHHLPAVAADQQIKDKETSWKHRILSSTQSYLESFTAAIGGSKLTCIRMIVFVKNKYIHLSSNYQSCKCSSFSL